MAESSSTITENPFLTEDHPIPGQEYVLLTAVGPHCTQKCDTFAIKIRGVFGTLAAAQEKALELAKSEGCVYDIHTASVGKWLRLPPPSADELKNVTYASDQNKLLNDIIQGQLKNQDEAQQHFEMRKQLVAAGKLPPEKELTFEELKRQSDAYQQELKEKEAVKDE